jgi:hypothetical protein
MKRFYIIFACIVIICVASFYYISLPRGVSAAPAVGGVIDLAGADFTDTIFKLDGEWEFYYDRLLTPEDFAGGAPEGGAFIPVPGSWTAAGYPLEGFATYRLTVLTDEQDLTVLIPEILYSSVLWVNGQEVFAAGVVGRTQAETVPGVRNAFVNIRPENGKLEFILQAANYEWFVSGQMYDIQLGRGGVLLVDAMIRRVLLASVIGAFLAMSLYHFTLFLHRRGEGVYLAFALLTLVASFRFFFDTNSLAVLFLPGGMGPLLSKVVSLLYVFHVAAIVFFAHAAFAVPLENKWGRVFYALTLGVPLLGSLTGAPVLIIIPCYFPMLWITVRMVRTKRLRITRLTSFALSGDK